MSDIDYDALIAEDENSLAEVRNGIRTTRELLFKLSLEGQERLLLSRIRAVRIASAAKGMEKALASLMVAPNGVQICACQNANAVRAGVHPACG